MKHCSKCGEKISPDDQFCGECGTKVRDVKASPEASKAKPKEHTPGGTGSLLKIFLVLLVLGGAFMGYLAWQEAERAQGQAFMAQQQAFAAQQQAQETSWRENCIRACSNEGNSWTQGCNYSGHDMAQRQCGCSCTDFWGNTKSVVLNV